MESKQTESTQASGVGRAVGVEPVQMFSNSVPAPMHMPFQNQALGAQLDFGSPAAGSLQLHQLQQLNGQNQAHERPQTTELESSVGPLGNMSESRRSAKSY